MTELHDLFPDVSVGGRVTGTREVRDLEVEEAWNLWTEMTSRPTRKVPERFASTYRKLRELKYPQATLLRCVEAAAYLPPRPRDPEDIRRVISTLDNPKIEAEALAILDSGKGSIYPWTYDEVEVQIDPYTIASILDSELGLWNAREHESAGILCTSLSESELQLAAEKVKVHLGEDSLLPSDIVRYSSVWRGRKATKVARKADRNPYESGQQESTALQNVDVSLDLGAKRLLVRGCPAYLITEYYQLAPPKYWGDVLSEFEENDHLKLGDIYNQLTERYGGWHPNQRKEPEW